MKNLSVKLFLIFIIAFEFSACNATSMGGKKTKTTPSLIEKSQEEIIKFPINAEIINTSNEYELIINIPESDNVSVSVYDKTANAAINVLKKHFLSTTTRFEGRSGLAHSKKKNDIAIYFEAKIHEDPSLLRLLIRGEEQINNRELFAYDITEPFKIKKSQAGGIGSWVAAMVSMGIGGIALDKQLDKAAQKATLINFDNALSIILNDISNNISKDSQLLEYTTYLPRGTPSTIKTLPDTQKPPKPPVALIHAGTGFIFNSEGLVISNYHVVEKANSIKVRFSTGEGVEAKFVLKDDSNDIVVLKLESIPSNIVTNMSLGDSSKMNVGDKVFTIGYPFSNILGKQPRYTEGIINSLYGVQDDPRWFQISVPIQPGNSGGPLFNERGEIIGITVASLDAKNVFEITGAIPQNINFAIKSAYIKNLLSMLPDLGSAKVMPTDLSFARKKSKSFIEKITNNIVLIEAE